MITISQNLETYLSVALFVGIFGVLIYLFVKALIDFRNKNQKMLKEMEQPYCETPLFECKAVVVEKFCQRENKGSIRTPDTKECCYVVVKTIDGKIRECSVTPEEYFNAKENQEVTVAIENDRIFGINFE